MKLLRLTIFALMSLLSTACLNAKEVSQKIVTAYGLEISIGAGLSIIFQVNGVPFKPKKAGTVSALSVPINGEVIPGENKMEVLIGTAEVMPDSSKTIILSKLPDDPTLIVHLQQDNTSEPSPGVYETKIENLQTSVWEPEIKEGKVVFPQKLSFNFNASNDHPAPLWHGAKARDVEEVQEKLIKTYRDIVSKLQEGDTKSIGIMRKLVYQDAAIAYPLGGTAEERLSRGVSQISRILSRPNIVVPDLMEPLECKAYADGRLFECFAADGNPPVRMQSPNKAPIYYKFKFSDIDNKLRIVR